MTRYLAAAALALVGAGLWGCTTPPEPAAGPVVRLSVLGTNDTHGELARLATLSGYVAALRAAPATDAVVLLDAGDMWQGTLESNMVEGASVVAAYNALGYDAAAIGNHEFDFGPAGDAFIPESPQDDPRGALKARAAQASFPLLAANLVNAATGRPVDWPNVRASVLLKRAGVAIGVIGVTTIETLETTIRANTFGLDVAPLAPAIEREARRLRDDGAVLVIVAAHAGGACGAFDDPADLSSCDMDDEIFSVANALPPGLVDQIIAGHHHRGIAHVVNGIAITNSFSSARAFGRVDYQVDVQRGVVLERTLHAPMPVCAYLSAERTACAAADAPGAVRATYVGQHVAPLAAVQRVVDAAVARADVLRGRPLGVTLVTPITRREGPDSAIGRLMTDAIREATGADVAIHNVVGGIRHDLPAGALTFGDVYRAFPFDNRVAVVDLSGRELRTLLRHQVHNTGRRAGVSGLRVSATCQDGRLEVVMTRPDGTHVADDETLAVAANDFLLFGGDGIFTPITPADGFVVDTSQPRVRDLWVDWFIARGGTLSRADYAGYEQRRWDVPARVLRDCPAPQ